MVMEDLINDYKSGIRIKDLESKYNMSAMGIYNILEKNGVERDRPTGLKYTNTLIKSILYDYFYLHKTQQQIAKSYNLNEISIRTYIRKHKDKVTELGVMEFLKTLDDSVRL